MDRHICMSLSFCTGISVHGIGKNQRNRTQVFLTQVWQTQRARLQKSRSSWPAEVPQSLRHKTQDVMLNLSCSAHYTGSTANVTGLLPGQPEHGMPAHNQHSVIQPFNLECFSSWLIKIFFLSVYYLRLFQFSIIEKLWFSPIVQTSQADNTRAV